MLSTTGRRFVAAVVTGALALAGVALQAVPAQAATTLNLGFSAISFDHANATNITGTGKAAGDKVLYANAATINGTVIDALVTTTALSSSTISKFDVGTGLGGPATDFEVDTGVSAANGYATFTFTFYVHGTYGTASPTLAVLQNVQVGGFDIDNGQFNDFTGFDSYAVSNPTNITRNGPPALTYPAPTVRFSGAPVGTDHANIVQDRIVTTYASTSSFSATFGDISTQATNYWGMRIGTIPLGANPVPSGTSYSVTYDANSGTGAPATQTAPVGTTVTLSSTAPTRTGYTFASWNTAADGTGTTYAAGATLTIPTDGVTLYAQWTPVTYTLTYNGNTSTGGTVPAAQTFTVAAPAAVKAPGTLVKTGTTFAGWNTAANGTGTAYAVGSNYSAAGNATLYAQWATNYSVTYDGNGSTGGTVPAAQTSSAVSPATVSGAGTLVKATSTFAGWNTAANGTGTSYAVGSSYAAAANVTLYAQWLTNYAVTYNGNGSTGGSAPAAQSFTTASPATISTAGTLTRTGYTFAGWATSVGGAVSYNPGASYGTASSLALFAVWAPVPYSVTYDGNGSTGGTVPPVQSFTVASQVTISGVGTLTRTDFTFAGWNTATDGTGKPYAALSSYSSASSLMLYAQWVANGTLSYYANAANAIGTPPTTQTGSPGQGVAVAAGAGLSRPGYTFAGWNTAADGSGTAYAVPSTFTLTGGGSTLYAVWAPVTYSVTYDGNGSIGGAVPPMQSFTVASPAIVADNVRALVRPGYTFGGWNSAANGAGAAYGAGSTYGGPANITLYAVWTPVQYQVSYVANPPAGSTPTGGAPSAQSFTVLTSPVAIKDNTGGLAVSGYAFAGWNSKADGTGASYAPTTTYGSAASLTLYAVWTLVDYHVTYDANGAPNGTVPDPQTLTVAAPVTVVGNTRGLAEVGHTFVGWNTAANGSGTSVAAGDVLSSAADVTLYAQWSLDHYSITFDKNGGSGLAPTMPPPGYGTSVTLPAGTGLSLSGYRLSAWSTAANGPGTSYAPLGSFVVPAADTTLYARWTATDYTVSFIGNGNSGGDAPVGVGFTVASPATIPGPGTLVKTGYTFAGWSTTETGAVGYIEKGTYAQPSDLVLYAVWVPTSYAVTYVANGGDGTVASPTSQPFDSTITLSDGAGLSRTGYDFAGWNTHADGSGSAFGASASFTVPASDTTLYAVWTPVTYAITYNGNGSTAGTAAVDQSFTVESATKVAGQGSLVRTGHTFTGWNTKANGTGTPVAAAATYQVAGNVTLYAQWSVNHYGVGYDVNGGDGTVASSTSQPFDSTITLSDGADLSRVGYDFAGWNTAGNGSGNAYPASGDFVVPASDTTLYAVWTPVTYVLSYNGNGFTGGTAPADKSFTVVSAATVAGHGSLLRTGHAFTGWNTQADGLGTPVAAGASYQVAGNVTLYAQWSVNHYSVSYDAGAGLGSVPALTGRAYGSTVPLSDGSGLSRTGFAFAGWNTAADGSGTAYLPSDPFLVPASDTVLHAVWTPVVYQLTYDANGSAGTAPAAQPSTIVAPATVVGAGDLSRSGFTFVGWNTAGDGTGTPYVAGASYTALTSATLYAQWVAEGTLAYSANGANGTVPAPQSGVPGSTVTIQSADGLSLAGYLFGGWGTTPTGGTVYAVGSTVTLGGAGSILYAVWTPVSHTLRYDGNGSTSGSAPADQAFTALSPATVVGNVGGLARPGYTFAGWNTAADGSGTAYAAGAGYSAAADLVLYAVWAPVTHVDVPSGPVPPVTPEPPTAPPLPPTTPPPSVTPTDLPADPPGTAPFGMPIEVDPTSGATPPAGHSWTWSKTRLIHPVTKKLVTKVVVKSGTWTLNLKTGRIRFMPAWGFFGKATVLVKVWTNKGFSRTFRVTVKVKAPKFRTSVTTVYFGVMSPVLTPAGKKALDTLIAAVKKQGLPFSGTSQGYVQATSTSANDITLSRARAANVVAYLRARGLTHSIPSKGLGKAPEKGATARRASVTITFTVR